MRQVAEDLDALRAQPRYPGLLYRPGELDNVVLACGLGAFEPEFGRQRRLADPGIDDVPVRELDEAGFVAGRGRELPGRTHVELVPGQHRQGQYRKQGHCSENDCHERSCFSLDGYPAVSSHGRFIRNSIYYL